MADDNARRELQADYCYACAADNPEGLHLRFERTGDDTARTEIVMRPELCGWKGILHGGFVSLLIDETASWTFALCREEQHFATRSMSVRFLRPTPTGEPLVVTGCVGEDHGKTVEVTAEIHTADGKIRARGTVEIARLRGTIKDRFAAGGVRRRGPRDHCEKSRYSSQPA